MCVAPLGSLGWRFSDEGFKNWSAVLTRTPHASSSCCYTPAATRGNKTESIVPLFFSLILTAPIIIFHAYYISLQVYVLRLDVIIQAIALVFVGVEALLSLYTISAFSKAQAV